LDKEERHMLRLVWLRDHMQYSDTLAQWLHRQFAYEFVEQPLVDWQREFAEGQSNGDWQCLIALENDQLLGGAALATNDLPERPELGPWLACVFIAPQARKRGLAEQLIEGICSAAKANGTTRLYLHTHDRNDYYAKRGWQVLERFQAWDKEQWLMLREL
jgi:N-acetylglutamate synthase-like GNAT family acetyltransferase